MTRHNDVVVGVPVATVWAHPDEVRPLDSPAIAAIPDLSAWMAALTTAARRDLHGRVVTQALIGENVLVDSEEAGWSRVVLTAQPSHLHPDGYPGWIPTAQLCDVPPVATDRTVTITARLAATESDLALSCGTQLPVECDGLTRVVLRGPGGRLLSVRPEAVTHIPASGRGVLAVARQWSGTEYIWGGCSGYGVDCSGLVHLAHRSVGMTVPRDADDQCDGGTAVPVESSGPGDVLGFSRRNQSPHHVGLSAGAERMLHSPRTGATVEEIDRRTSPYVDEALPLARRYVPLGAGNGS